MNIQFIRSLFVGTCLVLFSTSNMAQSCKTETEIPNLNPDNRYTNHGNGTVTDKQTGLMWKRCLEGLSGTNCAIGSRIVATWQSALSHATAVNNSGFAGYNDWRVPNINELESLATQNCFGPAINLNLFPNTSSAAVWSSSPNAKSSDVAWVVGFSNGNGDVFSRDTDCYVRLVRSGQ